MEENNCNRGAQSRLPLVGPGDQNLIRKETLAAGAPRSRPPGSFFNEKMLPERRQGCFRSNTPSGGRGPPHLAMPVRPFHPASGRDRDFPLTAGASPRGENPPGSTCRAPRALRRTVEGAAPPALQET